MTSSDQKESKPDKDVEIHTITVSAKYLVINFKAMSYTVYL